MDDFRPQGGSGETADRTHEEKDLNVRAVMTFASVLTASVGGALLLLAAVFSVYSRDWIRDDRPREPLRGERQLPPMPNLETQSGADLGDLRQAEDLRLRTYGWVDRRKGIVRIPIEQAMELVVRQALPARARPRTAD